MAKKTEKISAYYDKDKDGDLKGMIKKLQDNDGNYYNRSESEIIRMILAKAIPAELEKIDIDTAVFNEKENASPGAEVIQRAEVTGSNPASLTMKKN
jgi:hypothetical protein